MSENSDCSSSEDDTESVTPRKKAKINPPRKFCCFISESGRSLNFILSSRNLSEDDISKTIDLIEKHMGTVSTNLKLVSSHSAVLESDKAGSSYSENYPGDVFRLSYIHDCISAGRVLDISQYLKGPSKLYIDNFNYMNVIYFWKYSWESIPEKYRQRKLRSPLKQNYAESSDSENSVDSLDSVVTVHSTSYPSYEKKTHSAYTRFEKEAMLRYVVERKEYQALKGKRLYKDMEAANICPIRTWQSMKDHFQRSLVKEISTFSFLTPEQKRKLKSSLFPYQ